MKHLKLFQTQAEFDAATLESPSVNYIVENDLVNFHTYVDYASKYLTFEALEDSTFRLTQNTCEYSLDEGKTWVSLSAETNTPTVPAGNKIMFKATNPTIANAYGIGTFSSTGRFNVEGNIMSMLYGDNFIGQTDLTNKDKAFSKLFSKSVTLIDASNLILPATKLSSGCYKSLFVSCSGLTAAPIIPDDTTFAYESCAHMFRFCTSLTKYPKIKPAKLATFCCQYMFGGCTSLTEAPELPATELLQACYLSMFDNCTSLTTAPELPATTLTYDCYSSMFNGCSNLNYIEMLATDISARDCLSNWVNGVANTGTFVKHPDMTTLPSGTSGIPSGWTVEDLQE